ncbi:hypothetical protein N7530_008959 [Penicillium desertorum]|jgi:hypothetical protein|uniref:Uncharacterized protein n=1 Tax=Penicillium desertorum TaxID=1303715 RepID=A0A9W9WQV7_9EURO|nr:hypothetical protein N7530_008959 [Penicillium desertorum]
MFQKLRFSITPDAVKGALNTLQRSLVRILEMEVMASIWMVHIVDVASGFLIDELHHTLQVNYERSQRPTPTRTWYGV